MLAVLTHNNMMLKISCLGILQLFAWCSAALNLTVLHVNDIHVRFEETSKYSGACKSSQRGNILRNKNTHFYKAFNLNYYRKRTMLWWPGQIEKSSGQYKNRERQCHIPQWW